MSETELRELDTWIAEHVMGWKRIMYPDGDVELIRPNLLDHFKQRFQVNETHLPLNRWEEPEYSTDPAAAMEVLKRCAERSPRRTVCICPCPEGFEVYLAASDYARTTQRAKTLEMAIALFARKLFTPPPTQPEGEGK